MKKSFKSYEDAYALYSEIVSGRDPDRKDATITYQEGTTARFETFIVLWSKKEVENE
jgi:hypothetical protein